ncbi:MAG: formyltetrahydrofolate deformylase [Dehalococcoidia bacterium]
MSAEGHYILLLSCPDRPGIVHAVSGLLYRLGGNIVDSMQYGDSLTGTFCMRVQFTTATTTMAELKNAFAEVGRDFSMTWNIYDTTERPRVLIMVSQHDHCLQDLLYRHRRGSLPMQIAAVVSNHRDTYQLVASHNVPFHHLPVTAETKAAREAELLRLITDEKIDLIILARYMQILSDHACNALAGKVINIHHSFLPGFKGAKPYHQAHARGVKLIGATAHYVTADLDEGPIIEQDITRVSHGLSPEELVEVGREIEQRVLSRAVQYELEHRVLLIGGRTVVFRPY